MGSRGRTGAANSQAKLKPAQVEAIVARHEGGGITLRALAAEYGVSLGTVQKIVHGKTWKAPDAVKPAEPAPVLDAQAAKRARLAAVAGAFGGKFGKQDTPTIAPLPAAITALITSPVVRVDLEPRKPKRLPVTVYDPDNDEDWKKG